MSSYKQLIIKLILSICIVYYWTSALTPYSNLNQYSLGGFSLFIIILSITFKNKVKKYIKLYLPFATIILCSAIFTVCFYSWNIVFNWYTSTHSFNGNIFRGAFEGLHSPFYGHLYDKPSINETLIVISSFLILMFCYYAHVKEYSKTQLIIFFVVAVTSVVTYGWHNNLVETFSSNYCHFASFKSDIHFFDSPLNLIKQYNSKMIDLGVHNNHYPPGILLLFKLEHSYWPYLTKCLVFLSTLLGLIPLFKLCSFIKLNFKQKLLIGVIYAISGSVLSFTEVAITPLMIPLSLYGYYFLVKNIKKPNITNSFIFGVIIAIYTFFTFTSLVYVLFCAVSIFYHLKIKGIISKNFLVFATVSLSVFCFIYFLIFIAFGFNIIECFSLSLKNNQHQMEYSGIDNLSRYFITSSANLIAYIGAIGMPTLALIVYSIFKLNVPPFVRKLIYSLITSVLIYSFSNQFYLEVERIWIFLTPFFLLCAGWTLTELYKQKQYYTVILIILIIMSSSVYLNLNLNQCY